MIDLTSSFAQFISDSALLVGLTIIAVGLPFVLASLVGLMISRFLDLGRDLDR